MIAGRARRAKGNSRGAPASAPWYSFFRMRFVLLGFLLFLQDDSFRTLADPVRRAKEEDRRAALESFRAAAGGSAVHFVAAQFLERGDRGWRLVYDRLKTPAGAFAGTVEGQVLVTFAGQRLPVSSGAVEKDVRDAAAAEVDAFLARHWSAAPSDEKRHREALEAAVQALEKTARSEAGPEVFRHFALAHLSALGDKAADSAGKLGFVKEGGLWGRRDCLALNAVARGLSGAGPVPLEAEKTAKASSLFGPRYAAALHEVQKSLAANAGFEACHRALLSAAGSGAPKAAADHVKALADGFKMLATCAQCKEGRLPCWTCQGKKRTDVVCPVCKGLGWAGKGERANVLIPCPNCKGALVIRGVGCPTCRQAGTVACIICGGKGWREGFKGCRDCRNCAACKGTKQLETPCAACGGKGRVPPVVAGVPTVLCLGCNGAAILRGPCKDCGESGLADCAACGGKGPRDGKSPARPKVSDLYVTEPCPACGGKAWPLVNLAVPCERCFGLGVRVKPALDASKVLD